MSSSRAGPCSSVVRITPFATSTDQGQTRARLTSLLRIQLNIIAIQSRFSGRKSDRASELLQMSPDAAMGGPQLTLLKPDGHLRSMDEIEADLIRLAIGHYRGRMTEVARRLGIGRSTLYRKLAELGIDTTS